MDDAETFRRQLLEGDVERIDARLLAPLAAAWVARCEAADDPREADLAQRQARAFFDAAVARFPRLGPAADDNFAYLIRQRAQFVASAGDVDGALQSLAEHAAGPAAGEMLVEMGTIAAKHGRPEVVAPALLKALRDHRATPAVGDLYVVIAAMAPTEGAFLLESMVRNQEVRVRKELADVDKVLAGEIHGVKYELNQLRSLHLGYAAHHERQDPRWELPPDSEAAARHRTEAARITVHPLLGGDRQMYSDLILEDAFTRARVLGWDGVADELRARIADDGAIDAIQLAYAEVMRVAKGSQPDVEAGLAEAERQYQVARRATFVDGAAPEDGLPSKAMADMDRTWAMMLLDGAANAGNVELGEQLMDAHQWAVARLGIKLSPYTRRFRALRRHALERRDPASREPMELGPPSAFVFTEMLDAALDNALLNGSMAEHDVVVRWMLELEQNGEGDEVRRIIDTIQTDGGRADLRRQFYRALSKSFQGDRLSELGGDEMAQRARQLEQESLTETVALLAQQYGAIPSDYGRDAALELLLWNPKVDAEVRERAVRSALATTPAPSAEYRPWWGQVTVALSYLDARKSGAVPRDGSLSDEELLSLATDSVLRHSNAEWDLEPYLKMLVGRREFAEARTAVARWNAERTDLALSDWRAGKTRQLLAGAALADGDVTKLQELLSTDDPKHATLAQGPLVDALAALPNLPLASSTRLPEISAVEGLVRRGQRPGAARRVVLNRGGDGASLGSAKLLPIDIPGAAATGGTGATDASQETPKPSGSQADPNGSRRLRKRGPRPHGLN